LTVIASMLPRRCIAQHKVSLKLARRDAVFTGLLALDREVGYQAMVIDEVGGPVLSFSACHDRETITTAPPQISVDLVRRGPVADLRLAYLTPEGEPQVFVSGALVRVVWRHEEGAAEHLLDLEKGVVLQIREQTHQRLVRTIDYAWNTTDDPPVLTGLVIVNHSLHYSVRTTVLESRVASQEELARIIHQCSTPAQGTQQSAAFS